MTLTPLRMFAATLLIGAVLSTVVLLSVAASPSPSASPSALAPPPPAVGTSTPAKPLPTSPSLPAATLDELEQRALRHAVERLTLNAGPAPAILRTLVRVQQNAAPDFGWWEIDWPDRAKFEAKYFPRTSFVELNCRISKDEWSRSTVAVDRATGATRPIRRYDIDGLLQDDAAFTALLRETKIRLTSEADVAAFAAWVQSISSGPVGMFGYCGNSKVSTMTEKVDRGWTYVTKVDGAMHLSWLISCDADGLITDFDRNVLKIPPVSTREQNRTRRLAERKRKEEAKAWWVEEAKQADLAALTAKADLIGVATDFTLQSGTVRLYRVFTFSDGGLRFGDRLGNYSGDFYIASVQFPAALERRFDIDPSDRFIVFLTARMDQGYHRDSSKSFKLIYDPAGEHAVLRATAELQAELDRLLVTKKVNAERNAAVRAAIATDSVATAEARNYLIQARWAAKRVADWSVEPPAVDPDPVYWRKSHFNAVYSFLRVAHPILDRATLRADPDFKSFHDDTRWQSLLDSLAQ